MKHLIVFIFFLFPAVAFALDCERPNLVAANYPLKYFAERISGSSVELPVVAGEDPAFWSPGVEEILKLQKADLIFLNGAGYEKWLGGVSLPRSKLVDTSRTFSEQFIRMEAKTHNHGPKGEHSHGEVAFTTWLDMTLAAEQARAVSKALSKKCSERAGVYQKNFETLLMELEAIDSEIKAAVSGFKDQPIIGSHPVYQYLARGYSLNIRSLHWEPEGELGEKELAELKSLLAEHPAKVFLWEAKPSAENVAVVSSLGLKSLVFSPVANQPREGDLLNMMRENVAAISNEK